MQKPEVKLIAFYLPQFHPINENDKWWGRGFTEWTSAIKSKKRFKSHYQPHIPANLGFYDLRLSEARQAQADLASEYGISGFCYYHYWFKGKRLLERPFNEVFLSGKPDYPFCLCWANENWTRRWDGMEDEILIEQKYSEDDDLSHIKWLLKVFEDKRYIRIDGKPLFLVYRASKLPNPRKTAQIWREKAKKCNIGDIYLCKVESFYDEHYDHAEIGFDASVEFQPDWFHMGKPLCRDKLSLLKTKLGIQNKFFQENLVYEYEEVVRNMINKGTNGYITYPCVTPSFDNTPRRKTKAAVFINSNPEIYQNWLISAIKRAIKIGFSEKIVFINAWNEWGEGNHLEPDQKFGLDYLIASKRAIHKVLNNKA